MRRACLMLLPITFACAACDGPVWTETEPSEAVPALSGDFDPARCGTITGRVRWNGPIPVHTPIMIGVSSDDGSVHYRHYENPNALRVDPGTRAVAGAVVFLEQVNPAQSRPWDHAAVRIEIHDADIRVMHGDQARHVGFVHRGDAIEMVSCEPAFHALRARGAAFFSFAFPDPDKPIRRALTKPGIVDLTSAAAKYWHQAYLFVGDHPYFALTESDGLFTLPQVPVGEYRLACWLPNGDVASIDRDPNMGLDIQRHYAPPFERRQAVSVTAKAETLVNFELER